MDECQTYFHPICIREVTHFSDVIKISNHNIITSCYCETHSKLFLISGIQRILRRNNNDDNDQMFVD